jgi:hypothetical protein
MKKNISFLTISSLLFFLLGMLTACSGKGAGADQITEIVSSAELNEIAVEDITTSVSVQPGSQADAAVTDGTITQITLSGASINVQGNGAAVAGTAVTISAAGTYQISGTLDDGQIIVDAPDDARVILYLSGAGITSAASAPILVENAVEVLITLADGSQNYLTSQAAYVEDDEASGQPNAAIYSHDDLTINGSGALAVYSEHNHGISSKDDLTLSAVNLSVSAARDGIKGKDSITVEDGIITITAAEDGMQSSNDTDADKGYIEIAGGTIDITTSSDGIQAYTSLTVGGGTITIRSGSTGTGADSAKGLKSNGSIAITGGLIDINTIDDALNSNGTIAISGGELTLATSDDGIHADEAITIDGGNITISTSLEGIESKVIVINDGNIRLNASDDGVNVSTGGGGMGQPGMMTEAGAYLEINGGYLYINARGDGLDSNGSGTLNDGLVIVNGPVQNMNGALDVNGMLVINGGFLVAVGSAGMAQSPSTASTQYSALIQFASPQAGGTMVHIESQSGAEILSFVPVTEFQTVVISSPQMAFGETYQVYLGGSASGTVTDGLYTNGSYTPGSQATSFTIASIVTGESFGMGGGDRGGRPAGGGGRP